MGGEAEEPFCGATSGVRPTGCFTQDRRSRQEPGNAGTGVVGSSGKMAAAAPCSSFQGLGEEERERERRIQKI